MKHLLTPLAALLICGGTAMAGKSANCCTSQPAQCRPAACGGQTQWYKAKDGTLREMVPYWTALGRAEDADDLEIRVKGVESELAAANAAIESARAAAATQKAEYEAIIADLTKQRDSERQIAAAEKSRADNAEAALAASEKQITALQESEKQSAVQLAALKTESEELKSTGAELKKQVAELTAARDAALAETQVVQAKLTKITQDAAESKKPEVQEEAAKQDGDSPKP